MKVGLFRHNKKISMNLLIIMAPAKFRIKFSHKLQTCMKPIPKLIIRYPKHLKKIIKKLNLKTKI